jgi:hypothetical protein
MPSLPDLPKEILLIAAGYLDVAEVNEELRLRDWINK